MKPFDEYYQRCQVTEWKEHYINYTKLKQKIRSYGKRRRRLKNGDLDWSAVFDNDLSPSQEREEKKSRVNKPSSASNAAEEGEQTTFGYATLRDGDASSSTSGEIVGNLFVCGADVFVGEDEEKTNEEKLSKMERAEFKSLLQNELTKATRWVQVRWINDLKATAAATNERFDEAEEEKIVLDLYGFLVANVCTLRQLLLRYNTHVRTYDDGMFLSEYEMYSDKSRHLYQPCTQQETITFEVDPSAALDGASNDDDEDDVEGAAHNSNRSRAQTEITDTSFGCYSLASLVTIDVDGHSTQPALIDFVEPLQERIITLPSYWSSAACINDITSGASVVGAGLINIEPLKEDNMTPNAYYSDHFDVRNGDSNNYHTFRKRANELESILDKISWKQQTKYLTKNHPLYANSNRVTKATATGGGSSTALKSWLSSLVSTSSKRDRLMQTMRSFYVTGSDHLGISMEPKFLTNVRGFKKEMKSLALWKESQKKSIEGDEVNKNDDEIRSECTTETFGNEMGMDPANVWPLVLNLMSCFLHMMNTYIIEPSSAYYANALGANDALAGVMMGMAPWFTLASAVMYSVWTNKSYKAPTLCASALMVIGNVMYGVAYSYKSIELCLIGRAISGFGAPRIINRRYVADATPFKYRTMSSAAFALMTALGAASGPGFAILLDMVPEFTFTIPFLYGAANDYDGGNGQQQRQLLEQSFNGMTGPGFIMAVLWFVYSLIIIFTFHEPNRSGLDELKKREQQNTIISVNGASSDANSPLEEALRSADKMDPYVDEDDNSTIGSSSFYSDAGSSFFSLDSGGSSKPSKSKKISKHNPMYCIKNMTRATVLCMTLIFFKRIALESIVGSTSVITKNRYEWSIRNVGVLHLVNGLLVIPVSVVAGWLSQFREDRCLAMWFMGITSFGMFLMIDFTDLFVGTNSSDTYNEGMFFAVGPVQYIAGSLVAFSGVEACESYVASLMSKVVPSSLAVGTFNSGLLTTLVGTGGRAVGDVFITAMGLISIRNLLNLLIVPGMSLMLLSMLLLWKNYKLVVV